MYYPCSGALVETAARGPDGPDAGPLFDRLANAEPNPKTLEANSTDFSFFLKKYIIMAKVKATIKL